MMSLGQIVAMNQEVGRRAAQRRLVPYVIEHESELDLMPPFPFPNIGYHEPEGWEQIDTYFVDRTGLGFKSEPALTVARFKNFLEVGYGYAIVEEGPFQVYVGKFKRI